MSEARRSMEERVKKALFEHAFFRWESAVTIASALLLAAGELLFNPAWLPNPLIILGAGAALESLLVYISLKDPATGEKVVADMLKKEFQPGKLKDKRLQAKMGQALDYRTRIEAAIQMQSEGALKSNLQETANQIDEWLENIFRLAKRIDRHEQERGLLEHDRVSAKRRIDQLQQDLAMEQDQAIRSQIEVTLGSLHKQVDTIDSLNNAMNRAELQMEHTLSALGTIYSQTMLVDAKDIDRARAKRLQQEIAEEVVELSDVLLAMDEVYAVSSQAM